MFEQAFKNIDDVLWKDAGCTSELDYTEQTSWLLFLKYLDALEHDKATEAALDGKKYTRILDAPYRWDAWAAPKGKDGKIDHNTALTGDDLIAFVNGKLFPYLHGFKAKATGPNTIEYKIGEIFGEIKNRIQSGYGAFAVSESNVETVRQYIANQREHHHKKTFQEDYRAFPSPRWPNSSGSSACWTKRLRASPTPKPTPRRTSKTPAPSSKATSNPSSPSAARGGWRSHSRTASRT